MIFKRPIIFLMLISGTIFSENFPVYPVEPPVPVIVLIFDDFGYVPADNEVMQGFRNLPKSITISIIPGLRYSTEIAREFHEAGKEVMIHMPMEAVNNHEREEFELLTSMSEDEIKTLFIRANANIPFAAGLSNHQGSLFTADSSAMLKLIGIMADTKLYFIDSYTTYNTVAGKLARANGLRVLKRDVFIDSDLEEGETEASRLNTLREIAEKYGFAVGIGHRYKKTLIAVEEFIKSSENEDLDFVFPSEILK